MPPPYPDDPYCDGCFQRKPGSQYSLYPATTPPIPFPACIQTKYCTRCSQPLSYDSELESIGKSASRNQTDYYLISNLFKNEDTSSNNQEVDSERKFESHQALERAVSNARLGTNALRALRVGRSRPSASASRNHSRPFSGSFFGMQASMNQNDSKLFKDLKLSFQEFVKHIPYDQSKENNRWSAASGAIRIPERDYLVPTTLRKVLYKYFPHASEDPIPPPRLGQLGKPPILIADEDFRSEFRQGDHNRDTIKVPSPTSYTSTHSNSAPDDQFSPTTLKPLLTHSENSKQIIDPYLINLDQSNLPDKNLSTALHFATGPSIGALTAGPTQQALTDSIQHASLLKNLFLSLSPYCIVIQLTSITNSSLLPIENVIPKPHSSIILVPDSPLSTPPRSPPSSPPLPQVSNDHVSKPSRSQLTSSSPSQSRSQGSPVMKRPRSKTKALYPKF
ncbi:hypothetical protein HOY82DRAFT_538544 [Tuber indicum]|nr:hypothetical protein HOY82DRAFT_538544 [Tuber indicum]